MRERKPRKEAIEKGELFFLCHPGTEDIFSGYGLTTRWGSKAALEPLLAEPPNPIFTLYWDKEQSLWVSQITHPNEPPQEVRGVLERFGYGCLAVESDIGIVHVCHAADADIDGFVNKPVQSRWRLIKMPTAPLIRLELTIYDRTEEPYRFESFLNIAQKDQARVLAQLANQDRLYLAFYDDELQYRYTKVIPHDRQNWQYIDELTMESQEYWSQIPPEQRDFDMAKTEFMRQFV